MCDGLTLTQEIECRRHLWLTCQVARIGGYWWGDRSATAAVRETEVGLRAAFNDGPAAARDWLNLMTWNDPEQALAQCHGGVLQAGRRECDVPLWIDKPVSQPPPQAGQ